MKFASGLGGLGLSFEWKIKKVDEIKADISNAIAMGPFGSNIKTENFVARGVPVIRGINLSKGKLYEEEYVYITEEKADELKSSNAFPGDLVFTHRGTLGQVGIIPFNSKYRRYVVSQSQMKLTCNTKQVNPLFVYYFFKSNIGQHALLMNTSTTGVPAISRPVTSLKNIEIPLPALDEQQRIVDILNALDDKIELNNAINKNLEEMAQALFKRWFVDFEFPNENGKPYKSSGGEFEESELGLIPKGWNISSLKDISTIMMGQSPKSEYYNTTGEGLPFHQGVSDYGYRFPKHNTFCTNLLRVAKKDSILISVRAPVGRLNIADRDIVIGRGLGAINSIINCNSYLFYLLKRIFAVEDRHGSGTIFNSITKKEVEEIKVISPSSTIIHRFENIVKNIDQQISVLSAECDYLAQIRDTLLPKLMSGEIRVPVDRDHNVSELLMVAESAATYQS